MSTRPTQSRQRTCALRSSARVDPTQEKSRTRKRQERTNRTSAEADRAESHKTEGICGRYSFDSSCRNPQRIRRNYEDKTDSMFPPSTGPARLRQYLIDLISVQVSYFGMKYSVREASGNQRIPGRNMWPFPLCFRSCSSMAENGTGLKFHATRLQLRPQVAGGQGLSFIAFSLFLVFPRCSIRVKPGHAITLSSRRRRMPYLSMLGITISP